MYRFMGSGQGQHSQFGAFSYICTTEYSFPKSKCVTNGWLHKNESAETGHGHVVHTYLTTNQNTFVFLVCLPASAVGISGDYVTTSTQCCFRGRKDVNIIGSHPYPLGHTSRMAAGGGGPGRPKVPKRSAVWLTLLIFFEHSFRIFPSLLQHYLT